MYLKIGKCANAATQQPALMYVNLYYCPCQCCCGFDLHFCGVVGVACMLEEVDFDFLWRALYIFRECMFFSFCFAAFCLFCLYVVSLFSACWCFFAFPLLLSASLLLVFVLLLCVPMFLLFALCFLSASLLLCSSACLLFCLFAFVLFADF